MPQYTFTVNGQRHVFEGPDAQTTARFAQRWADQTAGRAPVTVADIQSRLGPKPSNLSMDLNARARGDVGDLNATIADVKAHPTSLLNVPKILSAVARYAPNAFGLAPAGAVDQVTGPVVRGINARLGTDFDPHDATDQILNAAGMIAGDGEMSAGERWQRLADTLPSPARAPPKLSVVPSAPSPARLSQHVLGQNAAEENVVPLSHTFMQAHNSRMEALSDLPQKLQDRYSSAVDNLIIDPIVEDPDYGGHNAAAIQDIRAQLAKLADQQRGRGADGARVAGALDDANESFRVMVNQQQPQMARELGLTNPGEVVPADPTGDDGADADEARGEVVPMGQYVAPRQYPPLPPDVAADLAKLSPAHQERAISYWKMLNPANDDEQLPRADGLVRLQRPMTLPDLDAPDVELPPPLPADVTQAWVKTAANANLGWRPRAYGVRDTVRNAFTDVAADPAGFAQNIATRAPNLIGRLNFNGMQPLSLSQAAIAAGQQGR